MCMRDTGRTTEAVILARCLQMGYQVSIPFGHNNRYDLIVDTGGALLRAQCKTAFKRGDDVISFRTYSVNTRTGDKRFYHDEIDVFLVWCPDLDKVYSLPAIKELKQEPYLRLNEPKDGRRRKDMLWAHNYELDVAQPG